MKYKAVLLIAVLSLITFSFCISSYAETKPNINTYADDQLRYYTEAHKTAYRDFNFNSQNELGNSKLGEPVELYSIDRSTIEKYDNGEVPLINKNSWLYPIYGDNGEIRTAIQISILQDGSFNSILGGFGTDLLTEYFEANKLLLKQNEDYSVKAVLQEDLSALLLVCDNGSQVLVAAYPIVNNGIIQKKNYDSSDFCSIYKEKVNKDKEDYSKYTTDEKDILDGGGITNTALLDKSSKKIYIYGLLVFGIFVTTFLVYFRSRKNSNR